MLTHERYEQTKRLLLLNFEEKQASFLAYIAVNSARILALRADSMGWVYIHPATIMLDLDMNNGQLMRVAQWAFDVDYVQTFALYNPEGISIHPFRATQKLDQFINAQAHLSRLPKFDELFDLSILEKRISEL